MPLSSRPCPIPHQPSSDTEEHKWEMGNADLTHYPPPVIEGSSCCLEHGQEPTPPQGIYLFHL
jgi:hypothetical protein